MVGFTSAVRVCGFNYSNSDRVFWKLYHSSDMIVNIWSDGSIVFFYCFIMIRLIRYDFIKFWIGLCVLLYILSSLIKLILYVFFIKMVRISIFFLHICVATVSIIDEIKTILRATVSHFIFFYAIYFQMRISKKIFVFIDIMM